VRSYDCFGRSQRNEGPRLGRSARR
jgi:hypothetical protein